MRQVTRGPVATPHDLWENIKLTVLAGRRSGLVEQVLANELRRRKRAEQFDNLRKHQKTMLDKYGKLTKMQKKWSKCSRN